MLDAAATIGRRLAGRLDAWGVLTITPFVENFALHGRQLRVFLEVGPFLSLIQERNL
jgi:hypothetical protein